MKRFRGSRTTTLPFFLLPLLTVAGVLLWIFLAAQVYSANVRLSGSANAFGSGTLLPQEHRVLPEHCANVDVVFTWVNGTDPLQLALLGKYIRNPQSLNSMFRDYGMLRFGVRSVEKFMPWVRKIYIFTNGQVPTWLNVSAERVAFVTHEQVFPNKTDLPTFNSNAIEANLRFLPGISECILFMNDDVFIGAPTPKSFFVDLVTGKLRLSFSKSTAPGTEEELLGNGWYRSVNYTNGLINAYYHPDAKEVVRHNYAGHYCHFFRKDVLDLMGERWAKDFARTSKNKFRDSRDVALPFLHNNVALKEGLGTKAKTKNGIGSWTPDHTENVRTWSRLTSKPLHCICIQDEMDNSEDTETEIKYLERSLCSLFPGKSTLELSTDVNPCGRA